MNMARVYCPQCGSEVRLPERSSFGIGMTISKESKGDFALPLEKVKNNNANTTKNNVEREEEKIMRNRTNNEMNNVMGNGVNNGMNGFDIDMLAKLVAAQLSGQNVQTQAVTKNASNVDVSSLKDCDTIDKNHWAENSQFYGKEICGYAYNPYMIRRFLPSQFDQLIKKYDGNVHRAITVEYSYMYSIKYTLEEVRKLAMLQKRDKIAFDERKLVFTLKQCKQIFIEYIDAITNHLMEEIDAYVKYNKVGKEYYCGIKGFGWIKAGVVSEKIVKHKVVKYLEMSYEFKNVFDYLSSLSNEISRCWSYKELYRIMSAKKELIKVPAEHKKSKDFMDCFIKAGSYYTLKQQLMFDEKVSFKGDRGRFAVAKLRNVLERGTEGYKIYAMLKEVNNIR
jgi:endogenous inhibitor of DNA gyrase (YacG/DUF329 family)